MSDDGREYRQSSASPATPPDSFEGAIRKVARGLRESIPDLSDRDKEFLYDMAREETRYPMPTVRRLCALSRRSRDPIARDAFATLILELSVNGDEEAAVTRAFDLELRSTGPADIAQRAFEREKNPITYERVKAALEAQRATTDLALLAVVRWGRQNGLESGR